MRMNFKNTLINALKVLLPVSIALYIVYVVYQTLSIEERETLSNAFLTADYFWVALSVCCGVLSHISRAYRWKYLQEPLGYSFNLPNAFMAVMVGYFANLALPRIGEFARCGLIAKYENKDVNKLLGTVVAERISDVLMLVAAIGVVLIFEYEVLKNLFDQITVALLGKAQSSLALAGYFICFILLMILLFFLVKKTMPGVYEKGKKLVLGLMEGVQTFITMEKKWPFLFHTLFIWLMYVMMIYICFFSFPELSSLHFMSVVACFVMGSISIVLVQGGIGAYPLAIMQTLLLYGISKPLGLALGWIVWTAQTIMIILFGLVSLILLTLLNKDNRSVTDV